MAAAYLSDFWVFEDIQKEEEEVKIVKPAKPLSKPVEPAKLSLYPAQHVKKHSMQAGPS